MVGFASLIILFLNFVIFYIDINLDLRNNHSRTFLKKNGKGILNKLLFLPYIKEINKLKFSLLIINYCISLIGFAVQLLLWFNLITDSNLFVICLFKFMIVYSLTLFIYKMLINRILIAIKESDSLATIIVLFIILVYLVYVVLFIIVPIYLNLKQ